MCVRVIPGIVLLLGLLAAAATADIQILAVVDQSDESYKTNLENAVAFLNQDDTIAGHDVHLTTIISTGNDSLSVIDQACAQLTSGVDLILDLASSHVSHTLRSLAEAKGVPHVAVVDPSFYELPLGSPEFNVSVNLEPPASSMLDVIRDIVSRENLTNVAIIYDHTFNLDNKPKRLLRNLPAQHLYLRMAVDDSSEINSQLDQLKSADLAHLFLVADSANAARYLAQANSRGMISFKFSWYVLTQDAKVVCSGCQKSSSIVVMTGKTQYNPMQRYITFMNGLSADDFNSEDIEMTAAYHFDVLYSLGLALNSMVAAGEWTDQNHTTCSVYVAASPAAMTQAKDFVAELKQVDHVGVFGALEWEGDEAHQKVHLEIKRVEFESGSSKSEKMITDWTAAGGLGSVNGSITNTNVRKTYRVVTVKEPPFIFKSLTKPLPTETKPEVKYYLNETSGEYYYGYCIDLIDQISQQMNFDYELYEPEDGAYGTMQPDGSWNGMVKELIMDRADIIVAPLSVMAERENVIDFTVPYYDLVGITILMKKPPFGYSVFKFMSVLESAVWGCVLSAFIIVSILLAVFDKYSPYSYQNNKDTWDGTGDEPRIFSLKEGLWFCMTSLTPQGGGEAPRALSGRLVAATWWVFGFIMIATYTANLAAFLTVSRLDQPIESLDDLAKQFKTKYAPQESTATETYFQRMADIEDKFYTIWKAMSLNDSLDQVERAKLAVWDYPVSDKFTNMWASMKASQFPKTFEKAIERMKNPPDGEEFAFIGDATQNKYAILTDCELWEVGEEFSRKPYALAVQEGSPLKTELSSRILQLLNQRVLEDLKTEWWEYDRVVCDKIEDESDGISIYNIGGVFLVILIGIGLGLITLAFEYYWYKWRPEAQARQKSASPSSNGMKAGIDNNGYTGHART